MRLVVISDTHGMHERMAHPVPDGDVLIHCGDLTGHGSPKEVIKVARWMGTYPHTHKIAIGGNHDKALARGPVDRLICEQAFKDHGIKYLKDQSVELDGVKFYGSPWTPEFGRWFFMLDRHSEKLEDKWAQIPEDTEVLITHGPAKGILDWYEEEDYIREAGQVHVGCELLWERIGELPNLTAHLFGHIHEAHGQAKIDFEDGHSYTAVNAAICTRRYNPDNAPQVVDL